MLIVCPYCASRYSIDDAKIGQDGRKVRCASCRADFFVTLADDKTAEVAAEAAAWAAENAGAPPVAGASEVVVNSDTGQEAQSDIAEGLDELFEKELAEAERLAATEAVDLDAAGAGPVTTTEADDPPQPKGWRRFLPGWLSRRRGTKRSDARQPAILPAADGTELIAPGAPPRTGARKVVDRRARGPGRAAALGRLAKGPAGLALAGCLVLGAGIVQREAVVKLAPGSASLFRAVGLPVNPSGLAFADITSSLVKEGEARLLVVEGSVRSVHADTVPVPMIEIRVRGADGRTLYTWTAEPPRRSLKPGEALQFRTRLATPPEAGRDVEVRFADAMQSATAQR